MNNRTLHTFVFFFPLNPTQWELITNTFKLVSCQTVKCLYVILHQTTDIYSGLVIIPTWSKAFNMFLLITLVIYSLNIWTFSSPVLSFWCFNVFVVLKLAPFHECFTVVSYKPVYCIILTTVQMNTEFSKVK